MSQGRVLVVEDDADIGGLLRACFEVHELNVTVVQRGQDALDVCRRSQPDVLVLDIMLPDMDGYEVCRRLRNMTRTSHIPIIFLTRRDERSDRIQGLELGADDYITKPFDVVELELRVRNAISRSRYDNLTHPITGLPSGRLIEEQLKQLIRQNDWAILYIGIQGLAQFGEAYGFVASEDALRSTAMLLNETVDQLGGSDDFLGHVGHADFIAITSKQQASGIAHAAMQQFAAEVGAHYDWVTRQRGYLILQNDTGSETKADLMSLAIGILTADDGPFADIREITEAAMAARREARGL